MTFVIWVGQLIWFFLPAGLANMAPVLVRNHFQKLAVPLDNSLHLGGKPLLGDHKTWRGLFAGMFGSGILFVIQKYLASIEPAVAAWSPYDYALFPWWFGVVFGFCALGGDIVKSFFKRRLNITEGAMWFPFDQIDFVLGATFAVALFTYVDVGTWVTVVLLAVFFHILVNRIGFHLGLKNTPW